MRRVQKHKVGSCAADLRARHHETEVFRFDVLTDNLQTMRHGGSETRLVAAQASVDAGLHVFAHVFHRLLPSVERSLRSNSDRPFVVPSQGVRFDQVANPLSAAVCAGYIERELLPPNQT